MKSLLKIFFICIALFVYAETVGQSVLVDSLERRLEETSLTDTTRIEVLNLLSREFVYMSSAKSLSYAQQALELSQRKNNQRGIAYAYRNLAANNSTNELYSVATEFIEKAIVIFEHLHDSIGMANCYVTLGNTYRRQRAYGKAVLIYEKASTIFRKAGLVERLGVSLHNLGETQFLNGDLASSSANTDEAIRLLRSIHNLPVLTACYKVKGSISFSKRDFTRAKMYYHNALSISDTLGANSQKEATAESLICLARIAALENSNEEVDYILRANHIAKENKYRKLLEQGYLQLVDYYIRNNKPAASRASLVQFSMLNDSIQLLQAQDKSQMLEHMLLTLKTAALNQELQEQEKLQAKIIQTQQNKLNAYLIISVLLLSLFVVLFHFYRLRKRANAALQQQKQVIEMKSKMLQEANDTKDKFFSIISHDLRSPLNSMHGMIFLFTEHIDILSKVEIKNLALGLKEDLDKTLLLTDNLIAWARSQMNGYEAQIVSVNVKKTVGDVISLYQETGSRKHIIIQEEVPIGTMVEMDLEQFRFIIRNLINNALKFTGDGGSITITAKDIRNRLVLYIKDTGTGMSDDKLLKLFKLGKVRSADGTEGEKGTGLGLVLIKEFMDKSNATIQVDSREGHGTEFRLSFLKS